MFVRNLPLTLQDHFRIHPLPFIMRPTKLPYEVFDEGVMALGLWAHKRKRGCANRHRFRMLTKSFIDAFGYHPSIVATIWNNIQVDLPGATFNDFLMTLYSFRHVVNITTLRAAFNIRGDNQVVRAKIKAFSRGFDEYQHARLEFLRRDPMEELISALESK